MSEQISSTVHQQIDQYIEEQSGLDLLRFITCGSVDDGKSTLIGRMLYEAQMIFEDQVAALRKDSKKMGTQGEEIDFALLVDGLAAEREQGITIDVAYRFFSTDKRKFIVADTPGHEQYTRNMVTGASTADVAVILVDASQGVLTQTRRHSFIASLLGIEHVVLAVNKMDLVDFDRNRFDAIVADYETLRDHFNFASVTPIPLSALQGDNVIERSKNTDWYSGPTLLGFLETVRPGRAELDAPFRFPVQWVNRPNADFRGYSGTIASGQIKPGDRVVALPSAEIAHIESICLFDQELAQGFTHQAVTLTLDREIDLSRGDVLAAAEAPAQTADQFAVQMVWMAQEAGYIGRSYWLMMGTNKVAATISSIKYRYNMNSFEHQSCHELQLNEIAEVTLTLSKPIAYEPFSTNKVLGALVLVDRYSNSTVAAGMISFALRRSSNVHAQIMVVDRASRETLNGHKGKLIWMTGLSGSGKSTIANAAEQVLHKQGYRTYVLDGDNMRQGLNKDLGFKNADRVENIRRTAEVAKLMVEAGLVVFAAFISPFRSERDMARSLFAEGDFLEVFVNAPLETVEARDTKGLYKKARNSSRMPFEMPVPRKGHLSWRQPHAD
tara:strand:- start:278 stop:2110 length:1833 start_codon:yes stop_codon:yes gene_type:complete